MGKNLLTKIKAIRIQRSKKLSWFDQLPEEQKKQLREVKEAYRNGEITHSKVQLFEIVTAEFGLNICSASFNKWLGNGKTG